jgi:hypothetical protein
MSPQRIARALKGKDRVTPQTPIAKEATNTPGQLLFGLDSRHQ